MEKKDLLQQWDLAQKALEKLMAKLPEMEKKQQSIQQSDLGYSIMHHKSILESAWEMAGVMDQKVRAAQPDDPNLEKFKLSVQRETERYEREKSQMEEELRRGGFASVEEANEARLSDGEKKGLLLELQLFTMNYETALKRCESLNEQLSALEEE